MDTRLFYITPGEKPLDCIKPDGGFAAIFRTIACVGDSLSSGELESTNPDGTSGYHDYFEYSWGQYMARALGSKVYNFSRGGMTASEYMRSWGEANGVWDAEKAAQCYILALGVNDLFGMKQDIGSLDDIDFSDYRNNNMDTFAGCYASIIQRYREIEPKCRVFLMTMPVDNSINDPGNEKKAAHAKLLYDIAGRLDFTYVIDLYKYGPIYDAQFRRNFYLGGHLNATGYLITAQLVMSYMDYIIRSNPDDFTQVGFIGKGVHSALGKW